MLNCIRIIIFILLTFFELNFVYAATATLTWNANTESDLAGYKIYRATQSCSAQGPLAPLLDGNGQPISVGKVTTYTDTTVPNVDGEVCYEITAFDLGGLESERSNRATKILNINPPTAPTGLSVTIQ